MFYFFGLDITDSRKENIGLKTKTSLVILGETKETVACSFILKNLEYFKIWIT